MAGDLWWRDEDADYIRRRSDRYPGATNIDPDWTLEAASDPRRIVHDPDPKSRTGAVGDHRLLAECGIRGHGHRDGRDPCRGHSVEEQWCGSEGVRGAGMSMVDHDGMSRRPGRGGDADLAAEVRAVREEYAEEEAEAAEVEAAENAAALEVALSLRIDRDLDGALRRRAVQEQISPSALVRRLLRAGLGAGNEPVLTVRQVEEIARRVMRASA
jgi:hypothetical protein